MPDGAFKLDLFSSCMCALSLCGFHIPKTEWPQPFNFVTGSQLKTKVFLKSHI